jgi:hypothetical protein
VRRGACVAARGGEEAEESQESKSEPGHA